MFDTAEGNALQELAKNGAEPNAFTSNAITCYYFDSTEKFYENLEILLSFVSVPYFTDESVEKEQGIIAQEIGMIEDNPEWQVYKRLVKLKAHIHAAVAGGEHGVLAAIVLLGDDEHRQAVFQRCADDLLADAGIDGLFGMCHVTPPPFRAGSTRPP